MSLTAPGSARLRLHRLTMVTEDDGVMVGRPDIASYAVFPEEGAQALRLLSRGLTVAEVAAWYEQACGESLDMEDFIATLEDLRFVLAAGEQEPAPQPVRWQRLGRWLFSRPAWACYALLFAAALTEMARRPALRPSYRDVFFTGYLSLIPVTLLLVQIPTVLVHEGFHALSGRRLGLPSTLGIGRRLYYLVAETRLDSLFSVPRRRRYLPFLAGMLADCLMVCVLTLSSVALDRPGVAAWIPKLCLAVSFTCVMRLIWQFLFYLETDLYYVVSSALRCSDLQNATRFQVKTWFRRLLRRPPPRTATDWSDRERAMARRYAPVLISGYAFSLGSLAWAGIPTTAHFVGLISHRFQGRGTPVSGILDALSFITLTFLQFGLVAYVAVRDRRARKASNQGALT